MKIILYFLFFCYMTSCRNGANSTSIPSDTLTEEYISIHFNGNVDGKYMDSIKRILKKQYNIDISYIAPQFTNEGKLKTIEIAVDCNDGFKGNASAYKNFKSFGFYRDKRKSAYSPFGIGYL